MEPVDEVLARRSAQGDGAAFVALIRRYEGPVAALIRHQVRSVEHAEDVWQETLLHAWTGLPGLREPEKVRAWLFQVARNRCRDFHKSAQRREVPTEEGRLEWVINRFGRTLDGQQEAVGEVVEALDVVPAADRSAARLFYLEGLTIAEIAARSRCPEGTVKRRLFHARDHMRRTLGVTRKERRPEMGTPKQGARSQPFPTRRPEIVIGESRAVPFAVDFRELYWWFGIPEAGDRTLWTIYDPPEWKLTSVTEMHAVRPARVHGVACVEVDVHDWGAEAGWTPSAWTMYGRLTDDTVEWLGTSRVQDGERELHTFLDEGFSDDWGPPMARRQEDRGRFARQEDGSFRQQHREPGALGAGMFSVKVGDRRFTCLRVFDAGEAPSEEGMLVEAYLTRAGRTVLFRRYNGRRWKTGKDRPNWDERFPDHARIEIDGVTFVHWYDCLTGLGCGIDVR